MRSLFSGICQIAVIALPVSAVAQSIAFTGAQTQVITAAANLSSPYGVAVDAYGNVYVADTGNSQVVKFGVGGALPTTVGAGLSFPSGVAVDAAGNVYIADTGNSRVVRVPVGGGAQTTVGSGFSYPSGVAVDPGGNIIVADTNHNRVMLVQAPPSVSAPTLIMGGLSYPETAVYDPPTGGYLIADSGNNRVLSVNGNQVSVVGSSFNYPSGVAVDNIGNIYVADSGNGQVVEVPWSGGTQYAIGSGFGTPAALALDGNGNLYVADSSANTVMQEMMSSVRFAGGNACPGYGCSGGAATLNFRLTNAHNYDSVKTLTGGALHGDFYLSSPLACTAPVSGTSTCTSQVSFYPLLPGLRAGAFQIGLNGTTLVSVPLYGIGQGPLIAFTSSAQTSLANTVPAADVAVDGAGNVFYASPTAKAVYELPAGGGAPISLGGVSWNSPSSLAVDGAGNLYVADTGLGAVMKYMNPVKSSVYNDLSTGSFPQPTAVTVDGAGNVYVVDGQKGLIKIPFVGGLPISLNPALRGSGMAVDGAGNIFIVNSPNVIELPAGGGAPVNIGTGLNSPSKVAVDAAGDVYITDSGNGRIVEVLPGGGQITVGTNLTDPVGLAVDGTGDVFTSDESTYELWKIPRSTLPALNFGSAPVGVPNSIPAQDINIQNIGNQPLTVTNVGAAADFPLVAAADPCTFPGSLVAGQDCSPAIEFLPVQGGSLTETILFTDNSLNVAGAIQSIPVTGFGLYAQSITFGPLPGVSFGVSPITLAATASSGLSVSYKVSGPATVAGNVLTITGLGIVTVTASQAGSSIYAPAASVLQSFVVEPAVGSVALGGSSGFTTITFLMKSAEVIGKVAVVTQGTPGQDFIDLGTGNCLSIVKFAAGETCTVNISFTPKAAGLRMGAVEIFDLSGSLIATQYVQGIGTAALAGFLPAVQKSVTYSGSYPIGYFPGVNKIAVDATGDMYVSWISTGSVIGGVEMIPAVLNGFSTPVPITFNVNGLGLGDVPADLAVDGAGNLFVLDGGRVFEKHAAGGPDTIVGTNINNAAGVAVDGAGTVYISSGSEVLLVPAGGGAQTGMQFPSNYPVSEPTSLALDSVGNLFIADLGVNWLVEVPANGGPSIKIANLYPQHPVSLAVDVADDVFVADPILGTVTKYSGGASTAINVGGFSAPNGLAVDSLGNLFVADSAQIRQFAYGQAPSLSFANTDPLSVSMDSPKPLTIENIGNYPLALKLMTTGSDFPHDASGNSCVIGGSIAVGQSCIVNLDFKPGSAGQKSESLGFSMQLDAYTLSSQTVALSGLGRTVQTINFAAPPTGLVYSPGATVNLNATGGASGNPVTFSVFALSGGGATVNGNVLSNISAGTIQITANQAGSNTYATAAPVIRYLTVGKATPTLTWATPAAIAYGTLLSATQLNASSGDIAGEFSYSPGVDYPLTTGTHTLTVSFTPTDQVDYVTANRSVLITVVKATPSVAWPAPDAITYGTLLSSIQLNATSAVLGTYAYSPSAGTKLTGGNKSLSVKFTPTDNADYVATIASTSIVVNPALPLVTWPTPAAITYGKALTTTQLNATANVAGTFTYTPALGALIPAGPQTLTVRFVPADSTDYVVQTASVQIVVNKATPTISWAAPGAISYGTLLSSTQDNATASVPGTFAYSSIPATTPLPAGIQTLTATFTPTDTVDYGTAQASVKIMVNKVPLTLTADILAMTYGSLLPTLTFTCSGFVNGESFASAVTGMPAFTTTASSTALPGSYGITISAGTLVSVNYKLSFAGGKLTISKAALNVVAASASTTYGSALPTLSYTISGFVNSDTFASSASGVAKVSTVATATSAAGTYPITVAIGTLASSKYSFTLVNAVLTINQAPLSVTANGATRPYGAANPTLTGVVAGNLPGDFLTITYTVNANATSIPGNYPITPTVTGTAAVNYNIQLVPSVLAVTPATLTIAATNLTSSFGSSLPKYVYTITGFANTDTALTVTSGLPKLTSTAMSGASAGTYPITVAMGTFKANANYMIVLVNGTLTVQQAPLRITVKSLSRAYGAANPGFSGTVTGIVGSNTVTVTYSSTATVTSPVGSTPITAVVSGAHALDYLVTVVPGVLTITPASLTVTAASATSVYGSTLPAFNYAITGYLNGDTATTAFTGAPAITTTATSKSGVGTYAISPSVGTALSANYVFKFVPATLTVTKAGLVVTALNRTKVYGAALPSLGYAISGFVNGDLQIHAVTGVPSLATTATAQSAVASYPITVAPGTLAAANYTFSLAAGALSVTPATLTVTATSVNVTYNQPIPALKYSIGGYVNSDTSAVVSGAPAETTTAVAGSGIGSYPITLAQGTLTAANYSFALKNGTITVKVIGTVATPVFKPEAGTYTGAQNITITDATAGTVLYYTLDGTTPTTASTTYTGPIAVSASATVKVIGTLTGYTQSAVATAAYTIQ